MHTLEGTVFMLFQSTCSWHDLVVLGVVDPAQTDNVRMLHRPQYRHRPHSGIPHPDRPHLVRDDRRDVVPRMLPSITPVEDFSTLRIFATHRRLSSAGRAADL